MEERERERLRLQESVKIEILQNETWKHAAADVCFPCSYNPSRRLSAHEHSSPNPTAPDATTAKAQAQAQAQVKRRRPKNRAALVRFGLKPRSRSVRLEAERTALVLCSA